MAVAFDAFSNVAAGTGNLSWTHTPVGTPRAVKVDIIENGGTNGVTSVTYGGVPLQLVAENAKTSGEAGTVVTYFLGSGIPTGAQTVSVTVSDAVSKRACATTLTAAADTCWTSADISIGSDSLANPTSTIVLHGKTSFVSIALFSGQNATTGITQSTGWTNRLEHAFGSQTAGWYTYNTIATANVACGWTQTADDAVMVALAITEAPLATDSTPIGLAESASKAVVFDARALPILITESASVTILTALAVTDSLAAQATESSALSSRTFISNDSCAAQVSEAIATTRSFAASDSCAAQLSESSSKDEFTPTSQQALPIGLTDSATVNHVEVFGTDSVALSLTEASSLDFTTALISATDTLTVQLSEQVPFFTAADSVPIGFSESRPAVVTEGGELILSVSDSCAIQSTDAITDVFVFTDSLQNFVTSDSLKVQLNGESAPPVAKTASDSVRIVLDEPSVQDGWFTVADSLAAQTTDTSAITAGLSSIFTASDSVVAELTDTATVAQAALFSVSDSMRVQVPEDVPEVATVLSASDTNRIIADEPSDQFSHFGVIETVAVQISGDVASISGIIEFTVTDSLATQLTESTSFGTTSVQASESLAVRLSESLTNSAFVNAVEALAGRLSEILTLFNAYAVSDSTAVQLSDIASPIFSEFVDISASDSCAVQAQGSISELISFLRQLTTSDSLSAGLDTSITDLFVDAAAVDSTAVTTDGLVDIFDGPSVSDSLKIGTTEAGLAIPRVTVNIETFTSDAIFGHTDGSAVIDVVYEAIEKTAADGCSVQCDDEHRLQYGCYGDDACLIGVGSQSGKEAVANASPETWNGNTSVEHGGDRPHPWRYRPFRRWGW